MKQGIFKITSNEKIARDIFKMTLAGDTSAITAPGQFVNIKLDGFFLRRPISVCDCVGENLTLIYKTVGNGTEQMSRMAAGDKLDLLTGLGNGYNTKKSGGSPLLVGGGVGVPPMYMLCKKLISEGKNVTVVLGFNSKDDVFYENEFRALGADVHIATADGTYGIKGFVTDGLKMVKQYSYVYACGPAVMLKNIDSMLESDGEYSMEERMGCGFGVCLGCTIVTREGAKRVCADGPVFDRKVLVW